MRATREGEEEDGEEFSLFYSCLRQQSSPASEGNLKRDIRNSLICNLKPNNLRADLDEES